MKPLALILAALAFAPLLHAQAPPVDPVGSKLFPPELIGANAETISLSESQREKLREKVEGTKERFAELGAKVKEAAETLGRLIEQNSDLKTVMAQFEKVQDAERDVRRSQLTMLLELRGILNEEQRVWLTQLKQQQAGQARDRAERVKAAAAKLREVEKTLDEALRMIEGGEKRP